MSRHEVESSVTAEPTCPGCGARADDLMVSVGAYQDIGQMWIEIPPGHRPRIRVLECIACATELELEEG